MEVAFVLPVLVLMFYAQLNFSRANMVLNTAGHAAYKGARKGIVSGATVSAITAEVNNELSMLGISNASVTVTPTTITDETPQVTVDVSIPMLSNLYATPSFLSGVTINRSCTLTREQFYVSQTQ